MNTGTHIPVVSMVPSWTETLIECGVPVVGRTRYCIHPNSHVSEIPIVGGTKDIDWDRVFQTNAELIILDSEENPKEMADDSPLPYLATHVTSIKDMAKQCLYLGEKLNNEYLKKLAVRWHHITTLPNLNIQTAEQIPGVVEWIRKPNMSHIKQVIYFIWRDPWMCVSADTFIGSMLSKIGLERFLIQFDYKYPTLDLSDLDPRTTLVLYSSEPFPFHKKINELKKLPFASAVVSGENFSWFGVRSLRFLENLYL